MKLDKTIDLHPTFVTATLSILKYFTGIKFLSEEQKSVQEQQSKKGFNATIKIRQSLITEQQLLLMLFLLTWYKVVSGPGVPMTSCLNESICKLGNNE